MSGRLLPPFAVAALLAALATLMNRAAELGLPHGPIRAAGYAYFALLVAAPLVLIPVLWRRGVSMRGRIGLSLLPAFLWWLTEIGVRLRWHSLGESLWLVVSPFQLVHFGLLLLSIALAELGCRLVLGPRPRLRGVALGLVGLVLYAGLAIGSIYPFLLGYRSLFQQDLLPMPARLPGPLDPEPIDPAPARAPNVVFILSDDHRHDFTSHGGHPFVETPALDRLAAEGVRFTRAYVTSSLCSPSRASFLTGTSPHRHGVWNNFTPWSDANQTFLEYLKPAGYRTAFVGKWHMPGNLPLLRGVDHFVTFTNMGGQGTYEWCPLVVDGREEPSRTRYIATELTDRALAWIERDPDAPFALYLSHKSVHAGFTPDVPDRGRYRDAPAPLPPGAHPWTHMTNAQYTHFGFRPLDAAIRQYAEAVVSMDREIGRLLDALDEMGLGENTVVIYASDNGYQWGERGLVDKRWPYETSIRIPFLVRGPRARAHAGREIDRIVVNVDVAPTLLELAGIPVPAHMQGRSLLPLLEEPEGPWRDAFLYTYYFEPPYPTPTAHAVVTDRHKLIAYEGLPTELFDLERDPDETRNLAREDAFRGLRSSLEGRLHELRDEAQQGAR